MSDEGGLRLGVVDCGTNTFTLRIVECGADDDWHPVFHQRRFVRLGLDSFRSGRISPQRFRRGLDVLKSFRETAGNFNVDHYRAFGCSAIRDASNGGAFVRDALEAGWDIEVLEGAAEAHWIHLGVADSMSTHALGDTPLLTVDIGGGSVEFIHWTASEVLGRWSLDLGVARLTDWIKPNDPLLRSDIASVHRIADAVLDPIVKAVAQHPPAIMVGTSGAFNTLMALQQPDAAWQNPRVADAFDTGQLRAMCAALAMKSKEEIQEIKGMHPDRVPYMAVACALIEHLSDRFSSVEQVFRSRHTLAEGVIVDGVASVAETGMPSSDWRPFSA